MRQDTDRRTLLVDRWEQIRLQLDAQAASRRGGAWRSGPPGTAGDAEAAYTLSELHVLHRIAGQDSTQVTSLAAHFGLTRGAISKIVNRLLERGDIISYRQPDNQKNVYYRCTDRGERVNVWHQAVHHEVRERVAEFFSRYTPQQLVTIEQFLCDVAEHLETLKGV